MRWHDVDEPDHPKIRNVSMRQRAAQVVITAQTHSKDFVTSHRWQDACVVLAYAILTGLVIVGFTLLADAATHLFRKIIQYQIWGQYFPLIWTPVLTILIVWVTRKYAPGAAGSGIPQVIRHLDDLEIAKRSTFLVSFNLAIKKLFLVSGGFLAGLSIGREGPAVQVGAGVMGAAERHLSSRTEISRHDLIVAGAAAGIAASFNTPLGGIAFALEQLSRRRSIPQAHLTIASIVLAGFVSIAFFGDSSYFGTLKIQALSSKILIPGIFVVVTCGVLGGVFSKILVSSVKGTLNKSFSNFRSLHPFIFAGICGFLVALMCVASSGAVTGAGYWATKGLLDGTGDVPAYYTFLKMCSTWLTTWAGVPAGVFSPSLAIGAGIGRDVATMANIGTSEAIPLIAIGMVGFLAATTQGPITAFVIVMEMVAGQTMVVSLMVAALISSGISRIIAKPMYSELANFLLESK